MSLEIPNRFIICTSQKGVLRHYELADGRELTVNIARNEWAMKNPDCYGNASRLSLAVEDDVVASCHKRINPVACHCLHEGKKIQWIFIDHAYLVFASLHSDQQTGMGVCGDLPSE